MPWVSPPGDHATAKQIDNPIPQHYEPNPRAVHPTILAGVKNRDESGRAVVWGILVIIAVMVIGFIIWLLTSSNCGIKKDCDYNNETAISACATNTVQPNVPSQVTESSTEENLHHVKAYFNSNEPHRGTFEEDDEEHAATSSLSTAFQETVADPNTMTTKQKGNLSKQAESQNVLAHFSAKTAKAISEASGRKFSARPTDDDGDVNNHHLNDNFKISNEEEDDAEDDAEHLQNVKKLIHGYDYDVSRNRCTLPAVSRSIGHQLDTLRPAVSVFINKDDSTPNFVTEAYTHAKNIAKGIC